jgi:hypothetical protein
MIPGFRTRTPIKPPRESVLILPFPHVKHQRRPSTPHGTTQHAPHTSSHKSRLDLKLERNCSDRIFLECVLHQLLEPLNSFHAIASRQVKTWTFEKWFDGSGMQAPSSSLPILTSKKTSDKRPTPSPSPSSLGDVHAMGMTEEN